MAKFMAFFTGLVLSVMVFFNGQLSAYTNPYFSNLVYHITGLIFFTLVAWLMRHSGEKHPFKAIYLLPGVLGSLTVIFNNIIVMEIGITLMTAFSLLGQVLTSLTIDQFGLLGKPKIATSKRQWIGTGIITLGLALMLL